MATRSIVGTIWMSYTVCFVDIQSAFFCITNVVVALLSSLFESTIDSEGFKGGTRGSPIMPRDAVSRTANVERTGRHKWVKLRAALQQNDIKFSSVTLLQIEVCLHFNSNHAFQSFIYCNMYTYILLNNEQKELQGVFLTE